ncbi:MAG: DUF427 domain-containing protein [Actinomycetota bacterium]|nr:DUF427 domain-containing protein [Actinomycetota bacterium]
MSLTLGSVAPFGRPTGGHANFQIPAKPAHLLYLHELPQRIRGEFAGTMIAESSSARMLHETRMLPRWYLPRGDVAVDLLEPSDTSTHCPFKGDARYWNLRVGEDLVADAFWEYPEPLPDSPPLADLLAPDMDKLTAWWEEDEELVGHPKDPFHRVDLRRSSRTVTVSLGGAVVASTHHPLAVDETGFPTRWYVPIADVDAGSLTPTETSTICPYKGSASYWRLRGRSGQVVDAAWGYDDPRPGMERLAGHVCFAASHDVTVDVV